MRLFAVAALLALSLVAPLCPAQEKDDTLVELVKVLSETDDPQFQLDVLKGLAEALQGRREVKMPQGWDAVAGKLQKSTNKEVSDLARSLSVKFGSGAALDDLRRVLQDSRQPLEARRSALSTLLSAKDPQLAPILHQLLQEPSLRGPALRGLAIYDHADTPDRILAFYPRLSATEKKEALATLSARASYAKRMVQAVMDQKIPSRDVTADLVRQLRNLNQPEISAWVDKSWGKAQQSSAEKLQEIARFKALIEKPGPKPDPMMGRAVFARTCMPCHTLFDVGGKVGPDLTGSARADLDYILQNIVDPNAVIPNDYRTSTIDTKDDRVITGIITKQENDSVTIVSATEKLTVPRTEIQKITQSEISMMPDGLLAQLAESEVRDLLAYLGSKSQVPLRATADNVGILFNGVDLTFWDGEEGLWKVENGEIVGKSASGLKKNEFLKSHYMLGDFRAILEIKLTPNKENSGIQFRSKPLEDGEMQGYQADAGAGWWGKLYEEKGRGLLWEKSGESSVKLDDWNTYEIVAVGNRILTAINGKRCVDYTDAAGAREGMIGIQLHAGGPLEVRVRKVQVELNPKAVLSTEKP